MNNCSKEKKEFVPDSQAEKVASVNGTKGVNENVDLDKVATAKTSNIDEASSIKEERLPKAVVNTSKAAQLVSGGSGTSAGMAGSVVRAAGRINYGGNADAIGGDHSATGSSTTLTKSGDRPGRQIDHALQHIDDAPAETFIVPIESIPQLSDGESNVGYNGQYRNAHAISQKGSGGSPADSDFFRTLDECQFDMMYFGDGQINAAAADRSYTYSTFNAGTWTTATATEGAYLPRKLEFGFTMDANGGVTISTFAFTVDDVTPSATEDHVIRVAGDAHIRNHNRYEQNRLNMIEKAGDENASNWSPLGKAIPNARTTNAIIAALDAEIGDIMFVSGTKLKHALAYQNNKAAKDGMRKVGPMFEMMEGNLDASILRYQYAGDDGTLDPDDLFKAAKYKAGSPALYIAINDSLQKYRTKGKLLSLPLSFKSAVQSYNQNFSEFRAHQTLVDEFNRDEVFGKLDADESGMTPYFISDGAAIIHNFNIFTDTNLKKDTAASPIMNLHWEDLRNHYDSPVYNFLIAGLKDYLERNKYKMAKAIGCTKGGSEQKVSIPITSTTTAISMWDVLICAAAKDIALRRRYALDILIQYEAENGYPYAGTVKLGDLNIGGTNNIGFSDIAEPLSSKMIPLNVGSRILMPEVFWCNGYANDRDLGAYNEEAFSEKGTVGSVVLPWYFSQNQLDIESVGTNISNWILNPENMNSMTFFDFRGGNTLANADRLRGMDPEQLKFCMDRMVIPPAMEKQFNHTTSDTVIYPTVYKYSYHEDGIPVMYYYVASKSSTDKDHRLTIADILKTPRELGLSMIAPAGIVTPTYDGTDMDYKELDSAYFVKSGPSFRIRYWTATTAANIGKKLFDATRSGNYQVNLEAKYYTIHAVPDSVKTDIGVILTDNAASGSSYLGTKVFPMAFVKSNGGYSYSSGTYGGAEVKVDGTTDDKIYSKAGVTSILKSLWTRMNMLPFLINPFDVNTKKFTGTESSDTKKFETCNSYDIFDFLHLFNMCGFRCGEYSAAADRRNQQRIETAIDYLNDPYIQNRE